MIYKNYKDIKDYILKLDEIKEQVFNAIEIFNTYLDEYVDDIDISLINKIKNNPSITDEKAMYFAILKVLGIDKADPYLKKLEKNLNFNIIKELDRTKYENNPYFKNIKPVKCSESNWSIAYDKYKPYVAFLYKDVIINDDNYYAETTPIAFFKEEFKYLSIKQNNTTWMLISPHEIETMEDSIKKASGNVLVYGLGLGYYPYMISLKDNVNKITIIEKDEVAINIFKKYILPQFENKNKIEVINEDAFEFTKKLNDSPYNYAFVDIYHNVDDGIESYIKFKKFEKEIKNIRFDYWIEKSLINSIRRCLITLIVEEHYGFDEAYYKNSHEYFDKIIYKLHTLLINTRIDKANDIVLLLKDENIKNLIIKL